MTSRMLQILLGVVIFFCSAPRGMAMETIREEVRADFFAAVELDGRADGGMQKAFREVAMLPTIWGVELSESPTESQPEAKRQLKRAGGKKFFHSKCRFIEALSAEKLSKGVARHPRTQDAQQERTEMIRFLQIEALIDC